MKRKLAALVGLMVLWCAGGADGREWGRFRGPHGQGISDAKSIPVTWTEKDFLWKVELPGGGHSSPVVWRDRVFVTCEDPNGAGGIVVALETRMGEVSWQKRYALAAYQHHADNSLAAATPAVNAEGVCILWQTAQTTIAAALDHEGREVWRRDLPGIHSQFGPGASPILVGDLLVFTHEQEGDEGQYRSSWIALDRRTGQTRWTVERKNSEISCSTPCVYQPEGGRAQIVFTSETNGVTGVDPATGSVLWELPSALPARVVGSPVLAGDMVLNACGKGGTGKQLSAVRIPPSANDSPQLLYALTGKLIPYVPTPLAKDGLLYVFHDQGEVRCLRVETGEVLWSHKPAGRFYGSPVWVDGRLYALDRLGNVVVLAAGPAYKLLAVNPLGEKSHATPAVAGGWMCLRTYSHLICLGGTGN